MLLQKNQTESLKVNQSGQELLNLENDNKLLTGVGFWFVTDHNAQTKRSVSLLHVHV